MSQDKGYAKIKAREDRESKIFVAITLAIFAVLFYLIWALA